MIGSADVVVIGSGGFGAATAYCLRRRGGRRVARFGPEWRDEQRLRRAAAWEYRHFYPYDAPGG